LAGSLFDLAQFATCVVRACCRHDDDSPTCVLLPGAPRSGDASSPVVAGVISGPEPIIFVVDDDDAVRDSLATLLEAAGYRVVGFGSPLQFLDALQPDHNGCLVVDLDLPGMAGVDVVRVLIDRRVDLPAILMTGGMRDRQLKDRRQAGIVGILEKPFGDRDLLELVEHALRRRP
jgi:FixJ family two-component response regulator